MWRKMRIIVGVAGIVVVAVLAGCQPQVVEVEVTRVVTETVVETVVEEVEVEGEVVVQEVEVTRIVEQEVAAEEEVEAEPQPIEATGSEEEGGSPFQPGAGQKVETTRVASTGWLDVDAPATEGGGVRAAVEGDPDLAIIYRLENDDTAYRMEIVFTASDTYFTERGPLLSGQRTSLRSHLLLTNSAAWDELESAAANLQLQSLANSLRCDLCADGGTREVIIVKRTSSQVMIELDAGENVAQMADLLAAVRAAKAAVEGVVE